MNRKQRLAAEKLNWSQSIDRTKIVTPAPTLAEYGLRLCAITGGGAFAEAEMMYRLGIAAKMECTVAKLRIQPDRVRYAA